MNLYRIENGKAEKLADQVRPLFNMPVDKKEDYVIAAAESEGQALELAGKYERGEIKPVEIPWAPMGTIMALS